MRIQLKTTVPGNYRDIMSRFDRQLFEALLPPGGKTEIVAFTGSRKGDHVHLRFLSPVKTDWISDITEHGENEREAWFVDVGRVLPFPLAEWTHRHIVRKVDERSSEIVDDISYRGRNTLWTWLMYPALYLAFYPRKAAYRAYFAEKPTTA